MVLKIKMTLPLAIHASLSFQGETQHCSYKGLHKCIGGSRKSFVIQNTRVIDCHSSRCWEKVAKELEKAIMSFPSQLSILCL